MNYQFFKLPLYIAILVPNMVMAGPYSQSKNIACPEEWSDTKEPIPVIMSNTQPWSSDQADKANAKNHISLRDPIVTIDALPVTDDDLIDDLLTVASECLVYRNFEADTADYVAPLSAPNYDNGWMPAGIF